MVISKDEAEQALNEIHNAGKRIHTLQHYRDAAPYFVVWGSVWVIANCMTEFMPQWANVAWGVLCTIGALVSTWLGIQASRQHVIIQSEANQRGRQFGLTSLVIIGYIFAAFALLPHLDAKQGNAFISLFWAFIYAFMGIWVGKRILAIGALTAIAILVGYFMMSAHYFLWMGLVTGSLLILGGLWLRKV